MGDAFYQQVDETMPHWSQGVRDIEAYVWALSQRAENRTPYPHSGGMGVTAAGKERRGNIQNTTTAAAASSSCSAAASSTSTEDTGILAYTAVYRHCREPTRCGGRTPVEFMLYHLQHVFTIWSDTVLKRAGFAEPANHNNEMVEGDDHREHSSLSPSPPLRWDTLRWAVSQYCHMRQAMKGMFLYADHNYKNAVQLLFRRCFRTQLQSASIDGITLEKLITDECLAVAQLHEGSASTAEMVLETLDDLSLPHIVASFLEGVLEPLGALTQAAVEGICSQDGKDETTTTAVGVIIAYLDSLVVSLSEFIGGGGRPVMRGRRAVLIATVYRYAAGGSAFREILATEVASLWESLSVCNALTYTHPVIDVCTKDAELFSILLAVVKASIHKTCEVATVAITAVYDRGSGGGGGSSSDSTSSLHEAHVTASLELYRTMVDAQIKCETLNSTILSLGEDRRWAANLLEARVTQTLTSWMRTNEVLCAGACAQGLLIALRAARDHTHSSLPDDHLTRFSHIACLLAPKDALVDALTVEIASEALMPASATVSDPPWTLYSTLLSELSPFLCPSLLTTPLALMKDLLGGSTSSARTHMRHGPLPLHSEPHSPLSRGPPPRPLDFSVNPLCVARWSNVVHAPLAVKTADLMAYVTPCCSQDNAISLLAEAKKSERLDGRQLQWLMHGGTMTAEVTLDSSWSMPMTFTGTPCFVLALSAVFERGDAPFPLEGLVNSVCVPLTLLRTYFVWLEQEGIVQLSKDKRAVRIAPSPIPYRRKLRYICSTVEMALHHQGAMVAKGPPAVPDRVVVARVRHMEAVIMKVMKGAGTMAHDVLLECTLRDMSRVAQVTVAQFKVCVGGLIQREYLKRIEGEMTMYMYCS